MTTRLTRRTIAITLMKQVKPLSLDPLDKEEEGHLSTMVDVVEMVVDATMVDLADEVANRTDNKIRPLKVAATAVVCRITTQILAIFF